MTTANADTAKNKTGKNGQDESPSTLAAAQDSVAEAADATRKAVTGAADSTAKAVNSATTATVGAAKKNPKTSAAVAVGALAAIAGLAYGVSKRKQVGGATTSGKASAKAGKGKNTKTVAAKP